MFERVLYIWSIRHPASGYVQGMNDLVTPLFVVFLADAVGKLDWENFCVAVFDRCGDHKCIQRQWFAFAMI